MYNSALEAASRGNKFVNECLRWLSHSLLQVGVALQIADWRASHSKYQFSRLHLRHAYMQIPIMLPTMEYWHFTHWAYPECAIYFRRLNEEMKGAAEVATKMYVLLIHLFMHGVEWHLRIFFMHMIKQVLFAHTLTFLFYCLSNILVCGGHRLPPKAFVYKSCHGVAIVIPMFNFSSEKSHHFSR